MYGEGNWKADEEYRRGLQEFARSHEEHVESEEETDSEMPEGADDESETEW